MKLYPVIADNWKMDGGASFGVVPRTLWSKMVDFDENNMIRITTRCLLIEDGGRTILIDAGMGRKQDEKYYGYRFLEEGTSLINSLSEIGYSPDDITDVVFTHLHDDHCGGAVELDAEGKPLLVFKNAVHHCSSIQWDWANHPNKREIGSFFPINLKPLELSGKLSLIEDETSFTPNVEFRFFHGHTRGMVVPLIRKNGFTFVFAADFIPSSAHIPIPFIASVDIQPLIALKEKEQFLEEAVDNGYYLIFQHDADHECASLKRTDKGVRLDKSFMINEILN
jgi:glyoxylase-like metal-dependent hydrolase (beta-lactamase superfamily II)